MGEVRGSIKTNRSIIYRNVVILEESYSADTDHQAETNWGVRYVVYGLPHRKRFFHTPSQAVEYIDFHLDVAEKLANPLLAVNPGKPEGDSGGS